MRIRFFHLISAALTLLIAQAAFAAAPIKIGALFAVTGPAAFLGEPERNTAKMVVDEINKAGGVKGRKLELVVLRHGRGCHQGSSTGHQADQG